MPMHRLAGSSQVLVCACTSCTTPTEWQGAASWCKQQPVLLGPHQSWCTCLTCQRTCCAVTRFAASRCECTSNALHCTALPKWESIPANIWETEMPSTQPSEICVSRSFMTGSSPARIWCGCSCSRKSGNRKLLGRWPGIGA